MNLRVGLLYKFEWCTLVAHLSRACMYKDLGPEFDFDPWPFFCMSFPYLAPPCCHQVSHPDIYSSKSRVTHMWTYLLTAQMTILKVENVLQRFKCLTTFHHADDDIIIYEFKKQPLVYQTLMVKTHAMLLITAFVLIPLSLLSLSTVNINKIKIKKHKKTWISSSITKINHSIHLCN